MEPFQSVEEAISFAERISAFEFCCVVEWGGHLYTVSVDCRAPHVLLSIHEL